ncbi:hypothetical protein [Gillisia limnaea]|uniref:Uncharacterized protein n=1 Tax=Gillisia limnaea (strain DSM 15749 / LMG 21470 / R-8282) TaxID=865937 RepID=H2BVR2_GILLR|nr:hypothetical protein [Gillisia limnaea]EHQ04018.1 hypothetical protein Gilli_3418 [Gillisia limnaea DSM 15749]
MGELEQSEEEILKLGKKIISELELDYTVNTLARWMAHYLAELMGSIEACKSEDDKIKLQKECCNLILKLWKKKDSLPFQKPLDNAQEFLQILAVLKKGKDRTSLMPRWLEYHSISDDSHWLHFVQKVKNNSEKIFYHAFEANLHRDLLLKNNEWLNNHKDFLTDVEKELIEHLNSIAKIDFLSGVVDLNDNSKEKKVNNEDRLNFVFKEIEKLIDEERKSLEELKRSVFKSLKEKETK